MLTGRPRDEEVELAARPAQLAYERRCMFKLPERSAQEISKFTVIPTSEVKDAITSTILAGQQSAFGGRTLFTDPPAPQRWKTNSSNHLLRIGIGMTDLQRDTVAERHEINIVALMGVCQRALLHLSDRKPDRQLSTPLQSYQRRQAPLFYRLAHTLNFEIHGPQPSLG